ncbi:MAG TPA: hypothetical protein VN421_03355 [Pseudoflavonifractor sp.]|nr:hypothetical protein [Pseudoflavonifractor sp.]
MDNLTFLYLALMIALVLGILLLLRTAQRGALEELARTLARGDVDRYLAMLGSRRLSLVLRRSTLVLLRLEGHIRAGDASAVAADEKRLEQMRLRPGERLEYFQKAMSFHLSRGEYAAGREYLSKLEALLEREPDEKLRDILADARLLIHIYADRDVSLIPVLERQEAAQSGGQRGVTQYRLAKLCHFTGEGARADAWLKKAAQNVAGTAWQPIVETALRDHSVLDER